MSTLVMSACWPLQMPPTQKAVLISLADNANDSGHCWPSISTICERTCFGRTAVMAAIAWLEEHGALTADRANGRHTTYVLTVNTFNQSVSRTSPAAEPVRQANTTSPAGGPDQSVSRTGPVRQADSNRQEPSRTVKKSNRQAVVLPDWLPASAWADWCDHRKAGKNPMTAKAAELSIRKLDSLRRLGHDPTAVIENAIENGWRGLYAPHEKTKQGEENANANRSGSRKLSVVERVEQNIAAHREREPRADCRVIDGTATVVNA